jgi:hypothetical protein
MWDKKGLIGLFERTVPKGPLPIGSGIARKACESQEQGHDIGFRQGPHNEAWAGALACSRIICHEVNKLGQR